GGREDGDDSGRAAEDDGSERRHLPYGSLVVDGRANDTEVAGEFRQSGTRRPLTHLQHRLDRSPGAFLHAGRRRGDGAIGLAAYRIAWSASTYGSSQAQRRKIPSALRGDANHGRPPASRLPSG